MRLLKTGLLGLMVMIVLACSPTSTGTKTGWRMRPGLGVRRQCLRQAG